MRLCIYKCYLACTVILRSVSSIFRHVQALFKSILAYSEPYVPLVYSELWSIPIIKHIQTPSYIYNTILNIFAKAPSWTFDTVLNSFSLFHTCYLSSKVTCLKCLKRYISDIVRHVQDLFWLIKAYLPWLIWR